MRRVRVTPRPGWQQITEDQGLVYGSPGRDASGQPRPYWDESVYYEFDMSEILALEAGGGFGPASARTVSSASRLTARCP